MSKRPADHGEREHAVSALDTCLLVEAAAGTGKTTLLVDRILALLRAGRARLPEIAAITFTEKAAGELKIRLREMIERGLREAGSEEGGRLRTALFDLDAMTVCTIHSFCGELIRERPVEAGVEPNFAVADELTASRVFRQAWEEWLAEQMAPGNRALGRAIERGLSYEASVYGDSRLTGLARLLTEQRDLVPDMVMDPAWDDARFAEEARKLRLLARELVEMRERSCKDFSDKGAAQIASLGRWAKSLECADLDTLSAWLRHCPKIKTSLGSKDKWETREAAVEMKRLVAELKAGVEAIDLQVGHRVLCDLVAWIEPFLEKYARAKAQRRLLDFQDLLIFARDVLKKSRSARDYFKKAYRYILVDEFQDTDPLQTEIVFFLSERRGEFAGKWDDVNLVPGKLFLVGDPKQSIYGFRRADLDIYGRVKTVMQEQGEVLNLSVNFRTVPEIIGEVNRVFAPLMTGPTAERFEPSHVDLVPYREGGGAGVRFLAPPEGMDVSDLTVEEWRRKESGCIAACIQDLVSRGAKVYDAREGAWRPMRYRDVAVLFRATTGLGSLEDAFRAHEAPYQVAGGKHYYSRFEFRDLLCVLAAVERPYDGLNVCGALRSPFFGYSDEELIRHHAAGGGFNYLEGAPEECGALAEGFETLAELHAMRNAAPFGAVLTELFERTKALQVYAMKPHGEQRVANLLKVLDMGRAMEQAGPTSFGSLVRWLSEMESAEQREGESPVAEADEDFVQLMTFHKAKGLEYPVVFLAHLGARSRRSDYFALDQKARRLDLKLAKGLESAGWRAALAEKQDREEHEMRRLFYVAMTRARDLLILPVSWGADPEHGLLRYLKDIYPYGEAGESPSEQMRIPTESFDIDREAGDKFITRPEPGDSLAEEAKEFLAHRRGWQAALRRRVRALNTGRRIVTPSGLVADASSAVEREGRASGMDIGTLVHAALERVDFREPGDIGAMVETLARYHGLRLSAPEIRTAAHLTRVALALPLLRERAAGASAVYREVPFALVRGDTLCEGRLDLIFIEDDGAVIVDYKTDAVSASETGRRAEHYRPQAELYARAMQALLDVPVKETCFLFITPGVVESVSVGEMRSE